MKLLFLTIVLGFVSVISQAENNKKFKPQYENVPSVHFNTKVTGMSDDEIQELMTECKVQYGEELSKICQAGARVLNEVKCHLYIETDPEVLAMTPDEPPFKGIYATIYFLK